MSKYLAVDERMCSKSKLELKKLGYELIEISENPTLEKPVSAHPDMNLLIVGEQLFARKYVNDMFTIVKQSKIVTDANLNVNEILVYPDNVALNCAVVGKSIICNTKYTSKDVSNYANDIGYDIINVNQGYAKCATCIVGENAIITEDDSIEKKCRNYGMDVLKIQKGHVRLDGYNYGFIGGCSGLIENNLLVFNGNIELHPQHTEIHNFCTKHNVEAISLNNDALYDVGSIVRLSLIRHD